MDFRGHARPAFPFWGGSVYFSEGELAVNLPGCKNETLEDVSIYSEEFPPKKKKSPKNELNCFGPKIGGRGFPDPKPSFSWGDLWFFDGIYFESWPSDTWREQRYPNGSRQHSSSPGPGFSQRTGPRPSTISTMCRRVFLLFVLKIVVISFFVTCAFLKTKKYICFSF